MTNEDIPGLYTRALASFGKALSEVPLDAWDLPTPCTEWTVQSLVVHVVAGEVQLINLLEHQEFVDPDLSTNILGPDPMSTWRGTALKAIGVVQETPLDTPISQPTMTLTLERLLGARISDNVLHGWDLSQALSVPYEIEEEIAEWLLDFWLSLFDFLTDSEHFSAPVEPVDDSPSARLLALLGRNPKS